MRKSIITLLSIFFWIPALAQENTVTIVTSGDGPTKSEAEVSALRNAIEQAYGVFVSADTSILNDEITRDEVATISSGNIKSYKEISSTMLANGTYSVMLHVTVSADHLISYAKSKCGVVEVDGGMFAIRRKMRELNKTNELAALKNLAEFVRIIGPNVYDTELSFSDYVEINAGDRKMYKLPLSIIFKANNATKDYFNTVYSTLEAISIPPNELESYKANNTDYISCTVGDSFLPTSSLGHGIVKVFNFRNSIREVHAILDKIFFTPLISKKIRLNTNSTIIAEYTFVFSNTGNSGLRFYAVNTKNKDDISTGYFTDSQKESISLCCPTYPNITWNVPGFFRLQPQDKRNSITKDLQQLLLEPRNPYIHNYEGKDKLKNADCFSCLDGLEPERLEKFCSLLKTSLDSVMTFGIAIVVDESTLDSIRRITIEPYNLKGQVFHSLSCERLYSNR